MIRPLPLEKVLGGRELVPQALIELPIWDLAKRLHAELEKGSDDFDNYFGAGAILDDQVPFAVMHYSGHPKDTSTIYLEFDLKETDVISKIISMIVSELKLPVDAIKWQRKDGLKF
jgi:hypothetical protein